MIVYRPTSSKCQDDSSKFAFDPDRGLIPFVIGHNFSTGISLSEDIARFSKVSNKEDRAVISAVSFLLMLLKACFLWWQREYSVLNVFPNQPSC